MALLPANPGEALWIGSAAGKNHANVGIGQGTSGGFDHTDFPQSDIEDGYTDPEKFYLNSDGNVVFRINASAGTTSKNTKHPRSECREMLANGTDKAAWDGRSGTHYLKARCRISQVTTNRPWNCFGQIHGSDGSPNTSDLIRLQTEGTNGTSTNLSLIARRTPPTSDTEIRTVLRTGYDVGDWFDYEIWMGPVDGVQTLIVRIDGVECLRATGMGQILCYFKWGCYLQDSVGEGAASDDWGAVEFERGSVQVWHTGYPPPTTPIFTGGTDPGGGPGGGDGTADTQAPTVPANLVALPEGDAIRLAWDESTDNVGVDHYNVYRYSSTGESGGGGTTSTFGRTDPGGGATTSSADKVIASKATPAASGTLATGYARVWLDSAGSASSRMLVYADSSGAPGALLATSDEVTVDDTTAGTVQTYAFTGAEQIDIAAGVDYWLAVSWDDPGTPSITYSRDILSSQRVERSDITYGTFPDPFGTPTGTFAGPVDMWAETVSGGAVGGGTGTTSSFGKQTNGASSSASSTNKTAVSTFTASAVGTLTAGHARIWMSAGSTTAKCVVYADSSGVPGALLASSDEVTVSNTAEAVVDFTFSGANQIDITNGTTYWLGVAWLDPGTDSLNISRDATASGRQEASSYAPNPFGTPTAQAGPMDVYVDVTEAAPVAGFVLIGTSVGNSYLDTDVDTVTTQTRGVGGIAAPAAGPGVVLVTDDSADRLEITTSNVVYDGGGHSAAGITIGTPDAPVSNVTVQNFVSHGCTRDAVSIFGDNITVQNCDFYGIAYDADADDINVITLFGDGHRVLYNDAGVTDFIVDGDPSTAHLDFCQTWNTDGKRSTSNLVIQGNRVVGPATTDDRFVHQFFQGEGENSTDGGGGGTGVSSGILIADNLIEFDCVNQAINLLDIHDVKITRNTFAGSAAHVVGTGDGTTGVVFYDDNTITGTYGDSPSTTAGPGPAGVANGTPVEYTYAVSAEDAAGNESELSDPSTGAAGPPDDEAPTVPTNLTATAGDRQVTLAWGASTDNVGVDEYRVYRDGTLIGTSTVLGLVEVGLTNGVEYSYTVTAADASGNESDPSTAATATPAPPPIGGVAFLPAELGASAKLQVQIAWGADLTADPATWTWTDVTEDVRQDPGISCSLGRNDESGNSNPASLSVVLDNTSGDYSLGGRSQYYPHVRRGTPVRVRVDPGDSAGARVLFYGFADGFTPSWGTLRFTGSTRVVTLSASGTLRRLAQGDAPVTSAYRRAMTADTNIVAYWPMEEGRDATLATAVRGGGDMEVSTGSPSWAASDVLDCSAPLPTLRDGALACNVDPYTDTGAHEVRLLLATPDNPITAGTVLLRVSTTGSLSRWDIAYQAVGLTLTRYKSDGSQQGVTSLGPIPINGLEFRLALQITQNGSNVGWLIGVTPAEAGATGWFLSGSVAGVTCGLVSHVELNPDGAAGDTAAGHLTVANAVTSLFDTYDALVAYVGESASGSRGRFLRLCAENGIVATRYSNSGETISSLEDMGPQVAAPLLDLLHECEAADQGQLWDGRDPGLSYTTRRYRELGRVALTLDAAGGDLAPGFAPADDDQRTCNRMQVTRLHGVTAVYEDSDGPLGTDVIGVYDDSATVNTRFDSMAVQHAAWRVNLGTVEGYRFPSVTLDARAAPDLVPAALDVIPGDRIELTGLADDVIPLTGGTISLIVEGIAHALTPHSWTITYRCSPFDPWGVGRLAEETGDTSDMVMRVDTDGSSLASAASAGATSLSVATDTGAALWTTNSDDFPLYLTVGGLPVRATACTGASSPQTFTVDALPVARASGAEVALWNPRRVGIG